MPDSEAVLKARLRWVETDQSTGQAALTCRRCGISKPTLRKWWLRYQAEGRAGLRSRRCRPHRLRPRKVTPEHETLILHRRHTRHLGPKGLQRELLRLQQLRFSTRTLWKVLHAHQVARLRATARPRQPKRYTRPVPGERVQLDTCKVARNLYQFTALDDCTRLRVLGLYAGRTAADATRFLQERLLRELPFPIQRVQTDRGSEFIGAQFQEALREQHIKFRPNRPAAPHLNGKVERSQRTDRVEFWATVDTTAPRETLEAQLLEWQRFYNQERTHSAIGSKTPHARWQEVMALVPTHEAVQEAYVPPVGCIANNHYLWVPKDDL